jgi:NTP pyrophosphatase (non-canonical NTP hydrolase)
MTVCRFKQRDKMNINDFQLKITDWASERGILSKATPLSQHSKTLEEVSELTSHLEEERAVQGVPRCATSKIEALEMLRDYIKDDIGDIIVTLSIQATMHGLTLAECLEKAYDDIKARTGKMVDGVFVKDAK